MLIRKLEPGFGRSQWATFYDSGEDWSDAASVAEVSPEGMIIATNTVRIHLNRHELFHIVRAVSDLEIVPGRGVVPGGEQ